MSELITEKTLEEYEAFVQSCPKGNFAQSVLWAKQKPMWTWKAIATRGKDGHIKGTLAVLIRKVPGTPFTLMYGCRGPVCDPADHDTIKDLLQGAKQLAKQYKSYVIKLDPDIPSSNEQFRNFMLGQGFRLKEGGKNFEAIQPRYVFRLNVEGKTEEEIQAGFHQKWRYNIRVAQRKGVEVKICGKEMVPDFARIMLETGVRDGFVTRQPEYFAQMLDNLGEHCRLYMAFYEGKPIAGTLAIHYGDKVWYLYGASSNEHRNLMPNYLLQWNMIQWAIETGCRVYDFREKSFNEPIHSSEDGLKGFSFTFNKKVFLFSLVALIVLMFIFFKGQIFAYASCFLGAFTLFALLRGQMRKLTGKYKWKKGLAALVLTLEAIFFFLIPLGAIVGMLIDIFSQIDFNALYSQVEGWGRSIEEKFGIELLTMDNLKSLSGIGQRFVTLLITNVSSMTINSVLMLFVLFYMLYSREEFETAMSELVPFSRKNKSILFSESKRIIVANAIGIPVLAIIQGIFAYVGYLIFGISNPIFYGVLTAFSTIIPILGTMIIWVPLAVNFAIQSEWIMAIGLALYGLIVIGGVDNVARFILQKRLADIHPLITVFGVIFGMAIFGFWGVIFGPLLISLFILFLQMFRHDYVVGSKAEPRVTQDVKETKTKKKLVHIMQDKENKPVTN